MCVCVCVWGGGVVRLNKEHHFSYTKIHSCLLCFLCKRVNEFLILIFKLFLLFWKIIIIKSYLIKPRTLRRLVAIRETTFRCLGTFGTGLGYWTLPKSIAYSITRADPVLAKMATSCKISSNFAKTLTRSLKCKPVPHICTSRLASTRLYLHIKYLWVSSSIWSEFECECKV